MRGSERTAARSLGARGDVEVFAVQHNLATKLQIYRAPLELA